MLLLRTSTHCCVTFSALSFVVSFTPTAHMRSPKQRCPLTAFFLLGRPQIRKILDRNASTKHANRHNMSRARSSGFQSSEKHSAVPALPTPSLVPTRQHRLEFRGQHYTDHIATTPTRHFTAQTKRSRTPNASGFLANWREQLVRPYGCCSECFGQVVSCCKDLLLGCCRFSRDFRFGCVLVSFCFRFVVKGRSKRRKKT